MALQNHPALYTGGSERFDSRPHVALYAQLMQRKQARDDAYDDYIRNLNKNINAAGLRNVDRPAFEQKLKEWQEFGMKNKEALRNPRKDMGGASMQFQSGYQDLQNLIAESKGEEEKKKPLVEVMTDPAKRDRLNEDELFPKISSHDQPLFTQDQKTGQWVRDANRRSFSVSDLDFNPKPFEQDKYFKSFDDIKPSNKTQVVRKIPGMKQEITTTAVFSPQDKDAVATRATADYMKNKSFKQVVDELDPKEYADFYKEQFGEEMQTPADLSAAYTLRGLQQKNTSQEIKDDTYAQGMARTKYTQDRIDARQRRQQDFTLSRDSFRNTQNAKIVDEYVQSQYNDPDAKTGIISYEGNQYKGKLVKTPKFLIDKYSINEGTKDAPKWNDPQFFISENGKYVFPVYRIGEKTKSGWDKIKTDSKPINMADWKIEISNDWIKNNRTANELADEFDVEGEVDESRSSTNIQRSSAPTGYTNQQPATYNGKKITVGVKNGKWYNTQTGEEIK